MPTLIWKEWHEQSWKLGFGCLVLGALALIGLRSRIVADATMLMWVCFLGLALLPVLSSTGLVPAERSEGSFESLLALPVSPWRILAAKTLMGLVLCAGPMLVATVVSVLAAGNREMSDHWMVYLYARSTLATLSLFIWMLALTIRLPNETRAGLLGIGVLIFWMLATAGLAQPPVPRLVFAVSPLCFAYGVRANAVPPLAEVLIVQTLIAVILWIWASKRLGVEGAS
jgi:hypothetical protein